MITASRPNKLIQDLKDKHLASQKSDLTWTEIWKVFTDDPWFQQRLNDSALYAVKRFHLPTQNKDDVQQEALIQFARSIERDTSLGFQPERGDYGAFIATIINRCCQKGLRQFRHASRNFAINDAQHPSVEDWNEVDEQLDLEESIHRVPEPYRTTIQHICDGLTIADIAKRRRKSQRTVYRWLEKGLEHLRQRMEPEQEP